ncbi:hypothetical protein KP509_32G025600 [Ceratopteris richardii]|uniref:Uncharacterized protein n=1 Tax=Ceratopteris richardii TaxID=49495 RepID=A0A8T2QTE4_CERRI|nr:hypothetical protein KP509_32G025600 [Ceratopteris richardii]
MGVCYACNRQSVVDRLVGSEKRGIPPLIYCLHIICYWVQSNIVPYASSITIIAVGNEVLTQNAGLSQYLFPAMSNIHNALQAAGLDGSIHVSTTNAMDVIDSSKSFPPSSAAFATSIQGQMSSVLNFLSTTGAPFLANVYPLFAYIGAGGSISLQYALFQQNSGVTDSGSGLYYSNLFDAQVDTLIYAMAAMGHDIIPVVVTETGWPHSGHSAATTQNAQAYNSNLVASVRKGTPKKPNQLISTYIFALFDENQKGGAAYEKSFGIFDPTTQAKNYAFSFV